MFFPSWHLSEPTTQGSSVGYSWPQRSGRYGMVSKSIRPNACRAKPALEAPYTLPETTFAQPNIARCPLMTASPPLEHFTYPTLTAIFDVSVLKPFVSPGCDSRRSETDIYILRVYNIYKNIY